MYKKGMINGKLYEVVSVEEYFAHQDLYNEGQVAVEQGDTVYPVKRNTLYNEPGLYVGGNSPVKRFVKPTEEEYNEYSSDNILDFKSDNIKDYIEKSDRLKNMEREVLLSPDNIFMPTVKENDDPEMRLLKEGVNLKEIDIDKYKDRFDGKNGFNNDKRLFNGSSISLDKLTSISTNLDMQVTLTLSDMSPDVPNPMGKSISINLNGDK